MTQLIVASLFSFQVLGEPVVGGRFGKIQESPWLASVLRDDIQHCGGSIISERIIVTAAHCIGDFLQDSLTVRVGSSRIDSGGSLHQVVAKKPHENFKEAPDKIFLLNDVGLIKVSPRINFDNNSTKMIQLAEKGHRVSPGTSVSVSGWGSTMVHMHISTYHFKSANLVIVDSRDCAKSYGDVFGTSISQNNLICAAKPHNDACYGDSDGGPLVAGEILVGIVSSGISCADPRHPGVYTDVARHRDWIDENSRILVSPA